MSDIQNTNNIVIKTFFGLEDILAQELAELGAKNITTHKRAVSCTGNDELLYKANYFLRTALKVLKTIHTFTAKNETDLYAKTSQVDWSQYIRRNDTIAIETTLQTENFTHSLFVSQRIKDAIVDQIRKNTGRRPSVDLDDPTIRIHAYISDTQCELALDSSGEPLFKRGYRTPGFEAPINEVLAAGLIKLSGWNASCNLFDLMCGSGTLLIEAALMAMNIPPGIFRNQYGFERWIDFNEDIFRKVQDNEYEEKALEHKLIGTDISRQAVLIAQKNIAQVSLSKKITISESSLFDFDPPPEKGMIIINPPYGKRIKPENTVALYKQIGDTLKQKYSGYTAWILSANMDALKYIGLHPTKKIMLYNSNLECRFNKFELYEGTRKKRTDSY